MISFLSMLEGEGASSFGVVEAHLTAERGPAIAGHFLSHGYNTFISLPKPDDPAAGIVYGSDPNYFRRISEKVLFTGRLILITEEILQIKLIWYVCLAYMQSAPGSDPKKIERCKEVYGLLSDLLTSEDILISTITILMDANARPRQATFHGRNPNNTRKLAEKLLSEIE